MAAGLIKAMMCVGGFLVFAVVLGAGFLVLHAITGGIVDGLRLDSKGVVGRLLEYGVPVVVSFWAAEHFVLRRLGRLFDRLER